MDTVLRFDAINPAIQRTLTRIIESMYDDGVDEILEVSPTGSRGFAGVFRSGDQTFDFTYRNGTISVVESRRDSIESYLLDRMDGTSHPYWLAYLQTRLDAAPPGGAKKRNCKTGKSCGGTCIAAGKTCRKKVSGAVEAAANAVDQAIRKETGTAIVLHSSAKQSQPQPKAKPSRSSKPKTSAESGSLPSAKAIQKAKSPYEVLGLNSQATGEQVKSRYRELSKIYHPDNKETGDRKIFEKVNQAYQQVYQTVTEDFDSWFKKPTTPQEKAEYRRRRQEEKAMREVWREMVSKPSRKTKKAKSS